MREKLTPRDIIRSACEYVSEIRVKAKNAKQSSEKFLQDKKSKSDVQKRIDEARDAIRKK